MASQTSVKHALAVAQRASNRDLRHRHKMRAFENALIRKASVSIAAGAFGAMKRHGVSDEVSGVPWKLPLWLGATLLEAFSGSPVVSNFSAGISDATMAVYMTNAIAAKNWVAGAGGGEF